MTRDQHDKELLKTLKSISTSLRHIDKCLEKINSNLNSANEKETDNTRGDGLWMPGDKED